MIIHLRLPDPSKVNLYPSMQYNMPYFAEELWVEVLGYLEYGDLKALCRVSKFFARLTNSKCFDSKLFRIPPQEVPAQEALPEGALPQETLPQAVPPQAVPPPMDSIAIHPAFERLYAERATHIEDIVVGWNLMKPFYLVEHPVRREFATCPAVTRLSVEVYGYAAAQVQNKKGVEVRQVMAAFVKIMSKPLAKTVALRLQLSRQTGTPMSQIGLTREQVVNAHTYLEELCADCMIRWDLHDDDQQELGVYKGFEIRLPSKDSNVFLKAFL